MDVTIKSIPDTLTEKEVCEWVEVLVKRQENKIRSGDNIDDMKPVTAAQITAGKKVFDDFKKANNLEAVELSEDVLEAEKE